MPVIDALAALHDLPLDQTAGFLSTTSVPDRPVDLELLRKLMQDSGLDASLVPARRAEIFDFQQVCRSVETRRGVRAPQGSVTQIAVGEVVTNASESVYQVTVEVRDEANRVIEHPKAMRVVYDKSLAGPGKDPIRFEPLEAAYADALKDLEHKIRLRFEASRGRLPGAKVREILRTLFKRMYATRWANSVYFVGSAHEADLAAMRTVVKGLYGHDADFSTIPVPNTRGVKEILAEKVASHVQGDVMKLMGDIADKLRADGKIKSSDFERTSNVRNELVEQAEQMMKVYGSEIATVREALTLVDEQVMAMWERTG
jgi:hypothetical protein